MSNILVVIDVQKDFYDPNGALYVPDGEKVIPEIEKIIPDFDLVLFTADWHPSDHCSFKENGGQWPKHCVAFTEGACISSDLISKVNNFNTSNVLVKGVFPNIEEYGSDKICKKLFLYNASSICFVGLAGDYCVKNTIQKVLNDSYLSKLDLMIYSSGIKSIDGGESLNEFVIENNIKEYVHK
jgi:nicotinamidase-related amidase